MVEGWIQMMQWATTLVGLVRMTAFQKPISCHLYPIRIKEVNSLETLTYDIWPICAPACSCGESLDVPVFRFLKAPIIRAFGEDFFDEMAITADALKNRKV